MARDLIASCASDPSLQAGLDQDISPTANLNGDAKASLFLVDELTAAQDAQACVVALGGITPVDVNDKSHLNMKNDNSNEALHNFLAYRSTVVVTESPLFIVFPHADGLHILDDLVMVRGI